MPSSFCTNCIYHYKEHLVLKATNANRNYWQFLQRVKCESALQLTVLLVFLVITGTWGFIIMDLCYPFSPCIVCYFSWFWAKEGNGSGLELRRSSSFLKSNKKRNSLWGHIILKASTEDARTRSNVLYTESIVHRPLFTSFCVPVCVGRGGGASNKRTRTKCNMHHPIIVARRN